MKAKSLLLLAVAALCLAMAGCDPVTPRPDSNLFGKWKFIRVENKATSDITEVPQSFDIFDKAYIVEFKEGGVLDFLTYCNVQNANYSIQNQNGINFNGLSPMTKLGCGDFYQWENLLVNNLLQSLTYSITDNLLIIECEENRLYFEKEVLSAQAIYVQFINCTLENIVNAYTVSDGDTLHLGTIGAGGATDFIPYQSFYVDGGPASPVITLVGEINGVEHRYDYRGWCGTMWYNLPYGYYTYKIKRDITANCFCFNLVYEEENVPVDLNFQQTYHSNNFSLKFDSVINDSRCPSDVVCDWAGNAEVKFIYVENSVTEHSFVLNTLGTSPLFKSDTTIGNINIKLVDLSPYPVSTAIIPQQDYVVKVLLTTVN